jgi:hypothetical protein
VETNATQPSSIQQFQAKWSGSTLKGRSVSQEHFLDLCRALGMPTSADEDKTGAFYTFERGAAKSGGGQGFADVWWEGKFGWEYKGLHANLDAAYRQLLQYREDLGNPPLLIVCDLFRFEIHTNFTGTRTVVHALTLDDLDPPATLDLLRRGYSDPASPPRTSRSRRQPASSMRSAVPGLTRTAPLRPSSRGAP